MPGLLFALLVAHGASAWTEEGDVCATFEDGFGNVIGRNRLSSLRLEEGAGVLARDDQLAWSAEHTVLVFYVRASPEVRLSTQVRGAAVTASVDGVPSPTCDGRERPTVCDIPVGGHGAAKVELSLEPGRGELRELVVRVATGGVQHDLTAHDLAPLKDACPPVLHPAQHLDGMWCAALAVPGHDPLRLHFPSLAFPTSEWPFAPAESPTPGPVAVHGSFTARVAGIGGWADFRLTAPPGARLDINGRQICEVPEGTDFATGGAHLLSGSMENFVRVSIDAAAGQQKTLHLEWRPAGATGYVTVPVGALVTPACTVDCIATDWTPWSPCPATCQNPVGTTVRKRPVLVHAQGGVLCGPTEEARPCEAECDCRVSQWGAWSPCDASGHQSRSRSVLSAPSSDDCPVLSEAKPCAAASPAPPPPPPPPPPETPGPTPAPGLPREDLSAFKKETLDAARRISTEAANAAANRSLDKALATLSEQSPAEDKLVKEAVEQTKKMAAEQGRATMEHAVSVAKQMIANRPCNSDTEADVHRARAMASSLRDQNTQLVGVRTHLRGGASRGALGQLVASLRADLEAWPEPNPQLVAAAVKSREALASTLQELEVQNQDEAVAPGVLQSVASGAATAKVVQGPTQVLPNIIIAQVRAEQVPLATSEPSPPSPPSPAPAVVLLPAPGPGAPSGPPAPIAETDLPPLPQADEVTAPGGPAGGGVGLGPSGPPAPKATGSWRVPPAVPDQHPATRELVAELTHRWLAEVEATDAESEEVRVLTQRVQALGKLVDRRAQRNSELSEALAALGA
jgi:hypothetical protein